MAWSPDHDALRGRVAVENWRDALPSAPASFALSESPRYVGRAIVALAADPNRASWNQQSVNSGQLALAYGLTDIDGSQPDVWRFIEAIDERDLDAAPEVP